jgi:hypothetical protein
MEQGLKVPCIKASEMKSMDIRLWPLIANDTGRHIVGGS